MCWVPWVVNVHLLRVRRDRCAGVRPGYATVKVKGKLIDIYGREVRTFGSNRPRRAQ